MMAKRFVERTCGADHFVFFRGVFELVTMIVVAGLRDVVEISAFDLGCVVAHLDGIEFLAAGPKFIWPLALRRE